MSRKSLSRSSSAGSSNGFVNHRSAVRFRPAAPEDVDWCFGIDIEDDYIFEPVLDDPFQAEMGRLGGLANRGVPKSEEHKVKIGNALKGRPHPMSEDTKKKIGKSASKTNRTRVWTDEMRANLSAAMIKSHRAKK